MGGRPNDDGAHTGFPRLGLIVRLGPDDALDPACTAVTLATELIRTQAPGSASPAILRCLGASLGVQAVLVGSGDCGHPESWKVAAAAADGEDFLAQALWDAAQVPAISPSGQPLHQALTIGNQHHGLLVVTDTPLRRLILVVARPAAAFDAPAREQVLRYARLLGEADLRGQEEAAHRRSEAWLQQLMDQAGDAFFVHDARGQFAFVNEAACRALGYTRSELMSMSVPEIEFGQDEEQLQRMWTELPLVGQATLLGTHVRKDRTTFPVEVKVTPMPASPGRYLAVARDVTERRQTQEVLRDIVQALAGATGETFLRSLTASLADLVSEIDIAFVGRLDETHKRMLATDVSTVEGPGSDFSYDVESGPCRDVVRGHPVTISRNLRSQYPSMTLLRELGAEAYVSVPLKAANGSILGALTAISRRPLSTHSVATVMVELFAARAASELERAGAQEALEVERAWLQEVLDGVPEPVMAIGLDHTVLLLNKRAREGLSPALRAQTGLTCHKLSHDSDEPCRSADHACPLAVVTETLQPVQVEHRHVDADGSARIHEVLAAPLLSPEGRLVGIVETTRDITARYEHQLELEETAKQLAFLATHDPLTDLPNRRHVMDRLVHAIAVAQRTGGKLGLLFIDLDRFKNINDTLGHDIGDSVLCQVARRLSGCVRESDTVGRVGGDEFVVLLENLPEASDAATVADKIIRELRQAFPVGDHKLYAGASIGIAVYPFDGLDPHTLMRSADAAMYRAMQQGRGRYQFFTQDLHDQARLRLEVERGLHRAMEQRTLQLHYQPQVRIGSGMIEGAEALLRWNDPILGMVGPDVFVPIAEETGLITRIGRWVLGEACRQHEAWRAVGLQPGTMSVNISAPQLLQDGFVTHIETLLERHQMRAQDLELEVTERVIMRESEAMHLSVEALRKLGVRIAIDDFGTGYSSLVYLHRFAFNRLKIDRSFVKGLPSNAEDAAINRAIVSLAHSLGQEVVAEGVETPAQAAFLHELGCTMAQGYLYSRAVPADAFSALLAAGRPLTPPS